MQYKKHMNKKYVATRLNVFQVYLEGQAVLLNVRDENAFSHDLVRTFDDHDSDSLSRLKIENSVFETEI